MTRRHFVRLLAAGTLGIPLLKPTQQPQTIKLSIGRNVAPGTEYLWDAKNYVRVPNWFGPGKDAYFRTLNGMVREFEREFAKIIEKTP